MSKLPKLIETALWPIQDASRAVSFRGTNRLCCVCGKQSARFNHFGTPPRPDAQCPRCGALERHRLLWHFINSKTELRDNSQKRMLHIAAEPCIEKQLRCYLGDNYITADLNNARAMVRMDITNINYPDEYFDIVFCNHVLEHVNDDRKAMRELRRVLKSDDFAILLVPITAEVTFEDPTVTDPAERMRLFGQDDHVRRYGPDYVDRLRESGFVVRTIRAEDLAEQDQIEHFGFTKAAGEIFFCTRSPTTGVRRPLPS